MRKDRSLPFPPHQLGTIMSLTCPVVVEHFVDTDPAEVRDLPLVLVLVVPQGRSTENCLTVTSTVGFSGVLMSTSCGSRH